ncbi:MAG TPA: hypothetical protein VHT28_05815 [Silvibacterium sp.]|nr:hypothetical protein [Silvibacterium sp.]
MNKRLLTVTIISWLYIAAGAVGLAHHIMEINRQQPFQVELVWILLLSLIAIVCGALILRGSIWARWLALAWIAFHVLLSFFHSLQQVLMHGLLFVLIAYVLFRPEARAYFRRRETSDV